VSGLAVLKGLPVLENSLT